MSSNELYLGVALLELLCLKNDRFPNGNALRTGIKLIRR